jgi:hypothetical protein
MTAIMRKNKWNELLRVCDSLAKGENPLSEEEIHLIWMCCHILKASEDDKVNNISTMAMAKGEGHPGLTARFAIQKSLEAIGSEAEAFLAPYQTK